MTNSTADIIMHMITEICRIDNYQDKKRDQLMVRLDEMIAIYRKEREE